MSIHVRMPDHLLSEVRKRGQVSDAIRTGLERYYTLLDRAREGLRDRFSNAQLSLLADVCRGTLWEPHTLGLLHAEAEDAEDDVYEKWRVDRGDLVDQLNALTLTESAALVDAIERFWLAAGTGIPVDAGKLLA